MYFFITTHPCLNSGHGRFCNSVHVLLQGSKISMLLSAGPSLLTIPPVAQIFPSRMAALGEKHKQSVFLSFVMRNVVYCTA